MGCEKHPWGPPAYTPHVTRVSGQISLFVDRALPLLVTQDGSSVFLCVRRLHRQHFASSLVGCDGYCQLQPKGVKACSNNRKPCSRTPPCPPPPNNGPYRSTFDCKQELHTTTSLSFTSAAHHATSRYVTRTTMVLTRSSHNVLGVT